MNVFLIFTFVFLPVGWFIFRMIRYTAKSLGDESPLTIRVSYNIDDWQYFTRFGSLFFLFFTFINLFVLYVLAVLAAPTASTYWHWFITVSGIIISIISLWWSMQLFRLEWQYWLITRNKTITLDPADKSLTMTTDDENLYITADLVDEIEHHGSGLQSSKMVAGYSYLLVKLKDGRTACLNFDSVYLNSALDYYFKTVPIRYIPHKIPWISEP